MSENKEPTFWQWVLVVFFYAIMLSPIWLIIYLLCGITYGCVMYPGIAD